MIITYILKKLGWNKNFFHLSYLKEINYFNWFNLFILIECQLLSNLKRLSLEHENFIL